MSRRGRTVRTWVIHGRPPATTPASTPPVSCGCASAAAAYIDSLADSLIQTRQALSCVADTIQPSDPIERLVIERPVDVDHLVAVKKKLSERVDHDIGGQSRDG
jgi:hypothetical protein